MNTLFCDAGKLERKLNRPVGSIEALQTLELKNAQIILIEDFAPMVSLETVDLSGNQVGTREGLQGLLNAPKLSSLDLRGCPVTSTDNYRRWVIARAPATLKMLDGKEVSALERRYAYNLFPECRPKDAVVPPAKPPAAVSLSQKAPLVAGEEDIFTLDVKPTVKHPVEKGSDIFSPTASSSPVASSFVKFFPQSAVPVIAAVDTPTPSAGPVPSHAPSVAAATAEASTSPPVVPFQAEISAVSDVVLDNAIVKSMERDEDVLSLATATSKPVKRVPKSVVEPISQATPLSHPSSAIPEPIIVSSPAAAAAAAPAVAPAVAPVPRTAATALERDAVLDNDVLSGKSFFDERMRDASFSSVTTGSTKKPRAATNTASKPEGGPDIDIGSMFFEGKEAPRPEHVSPSKPARPPVTRNGLSVLEEESMYSPLPLLEESKPVFKGATRDHRVLEKTVQTYNTVKASETGEAVSYGVEQVMAYVLNGFWPSSNAANGLFEFTIHLRDSAPDVFYVRVTSPTGVSVHSGRVPAPEAWAIDCKLTLTDDVMQEVLNGKTDPSTALLNGSLQVEGQLPKLLLFKEVFHFALSRFNSFRARWDRCIADEEQAMADRGKAKMLDLDISEALQFLLFAWRGSFPPSWGTRQTAYVLIGQLPDNVYYKGYRSNVVVTPPKVLLRLSVDSLEFVPAADSSDDSAMVMCEIWGKKSVLISLFTGTMSLSQTLALLNTPPTDANFKTGYCYAHSPWCDLDNEPIMWLSENRKENTAGKVPPFLFVRNMSHFDGANDFEEIMRCFDINPLSHHRFQAAARQRKQQETEEAEAAAAEAARRADSPATVPGSSIGRDRAASPLEWMEKLKDVKSDIVKRLGSSPSQRGNAYDESDDFFSNPFGEHNSPSSRSLKGSGRSPSSVARSASPLESLGRSPSGVSREKARLVQGELQPMRTQSGSVEVKRGFTPNAGFTDYEV